MIKRNSITLICLSILILISLSSFFLSYWQLDRIPYGFHVDEMSGSISVGCLITQGVDANNASHPLFSNMNYGTPKPPTFIYPAIAWGRAVGYSVASLRALTVTVHLLGVIGLLFLARSFLGWPYAILTVTVASLSPWTWSISRVAFESLFSASFLIWGIYFFLRSNKTWNIVTAALFFVAAMYTYPPFRLQIPLMLISLMIYTHYKNPRTLHSWIIFTFALIIPSIPLINRILSGEIQSRFNAISIFSKEYLSSIHSSGHLIDILGIFLNNYLLHFKWNFLFLTGDPSYVHSTRHFGILSWLDIAALLMALIWCFMLLINKNRNNNPILEQNILLIFLITNILIGVIPAALTNSELPNSLRITGSWPFMCLFSGYFLWQACERWGRFQWAATCALSILFAVTYFNVYFKIYPQESKGMFAYWTLEQANQLKTDEDWLKFVLLYRHQDYNARYFLMQYHGVSCTESKKIWEGMRDLSIKHGIY